MSFAKRRMVIWNSCLKEAVGLDWAIFADEAGDVGFPLREGTSRVYTVNLMLVNSNEICNARSWIKSNKRTVLKRGGCLEWKRLAGTEKSNDDSLSLFIGNLRRSGIGILPLTVIANKTEMTGSGLIDSSKQLFIPYCYGLAFKRIRPFLSVCKDTASVVAFDRNSCRQIHDAVSEYVNQVIPLLQDRTTGFRRETRYVEPIFTTPEDEPCHQLADFTAGLTTRIVESYLDHDLSHSYQKTWRELKLWHQQVLKTWRWQRILYHPYSNRSNHAEFLR